MKRLLYVCTLAVVAGLGLAAVVQTDGSGSIRSNETELEQLHAALQAAKAAGQAADPVMLARARELEGAVQQGIVSVPPQATPAPVSVSPEQAPHGVANHPDASQVQSANVESPLETQIRQLEHQLELATATTSAQMTNVEPPPDLKEQLNQLYAQRPENQVRTQNPLDQGNDICPGTYIPGLPYTDTGTTTGYGNNYTPISSCGYSAAPDVVYYFVSDYTGNCTVSLCGSSYDTYLYVVTGNCGFTQVACNDDYCGLQSQVTFAMTAGQDYTIFVDGYSTYSGAYVINVTDDCSVTCQGGDVPEVYENFADPSFNVNDPDGGCNDTNPSFQNIACGQTVCGVGATYSGGTYRDTDWYSFTMTQQCTVRVTVIAEFPPHVLILGGGCPYDSIYTNNQGSPCVPMTVSTAYALPAGNYTMFVAPAFGYAVPSAREYRATLECIPAHCVTSQPGDIPECAETNDPGHLSNDCDGGSCNTFYGGVASYQSIQCGQTYYGQTFTYYNNNILYRDTDWYQFTLTQTSTVSVTVIADNFIPLITGFVPTSDCWFMEQIMDGTPCVPSTLTSANCLQPGTYYFMIASDTSPQPTPAGYRVTLSCAPCCYDQTLNAPGSVSGTTCDAGDDCNIRPGPDRVVRVTIPYLSQWTFSLCSLDNIWDSFISLTDGCCGSVIEYNDDACGGYGLSRINCYGLPAGTYYVDIEGYAPENCGPYTLTVVECSGRCCYGDPSNPSCQVTNPITCSQLGGQYFEGETCASGCYVRPDCFANSMFSQQPYLPGEAWNAYQTDVNTPYRHAENFSGLTAPIGSIRFWGVSADYFINPCTEDPMQFQVRFYNNGPGVPGTQVAAFTATLTGTPTYSYGSLTPPFQGREYQMGFPAQLVLPTGWVEILATDPSTPNCNFFWMLSNTGDNLSATQVNNGGWLAESQNFSFCLGAACIPPDSLVIKPISPTVNRIYFKARVTGLYQLFWSTVADGNEPLSLKGQAYLTPGWWSVGVNSIPQTYARYDVKVDCTVDTPPPTLETPPGEEPLLFVPVESPGAVQPSVANQP